MTIQEIIDSLEEQAEDKDRLAGGDPASIFTHDADVLMEAARLLRKFDISTAVGEPQNLMQKYEQHCMFRANRLDGGGEVYGSLVAEGSASMMFPSVTVWHIVQYGYWNGAPLRSDDLVDPETAAIYLGRDDKYGHGIYVPLKDVVAALGKGSESSAIVPPPTAPLTLEELREMYGEPVWLESKTIKDSYWVIFNGFCDKVACFVCTAPRLIEDYGKTWLAYRRKPEEV